MRSVDRVREYFAQRGVQIEVKELSASTRTAPLAAEAVGAALGSIVKSLVFIADGRAVLVLVAGDQRADAAKIAQLVGAQAARIANAEEVREQTSYAIGGVPPVAHAAPMETLIDETLLRFEKVWAAAGAPNALFEIDLRKLLELAQGRVADIAVAQK
jgi:prolyl-tRNA editing enzyme YbaK/EbsC (Cys-tRNA(Pro) deacylase)